MSVWTTAKSFPRRRGNLSFQTGNLTVDFDRTKATKIFSHVNGQVDLTEKDVNSARQTAIDSSSLFSVSSVYMGDRLVTSNNDGSYTVLSHGIPSTTLPRENCGAVKMSCLSGNGTNRACNPGKCVSGRVRKVLETLSDGSVRVSPFKWQFVSNLETYYVFQTNGLIKLRHNRLGTSRYSEFYVPPNSYLTEEIFVRELFRNFAYLILVGGEDKRERFVAEGIKQSSYYNPNSIPVETLLKEDIVTLGDPWYSLAVKEIDTSRKNNPIDQNFLGDIYNRLSSLFDKAIQSVPSSMSQGGVDYGQYEIARPVYLRLPGVSGGYSSIDNEETVSKWLVSGIDEQLSESKGRVSNFYRDYLDPDTCYPLALDWLAQHIGMFGPLWDVNWPIDIKRTIIKNMFGWWDRDVDGVNHKSKILQEAPFATNPLWTTDSEVVNDQGFIRYGEIENFVINPTTKNITLGSKYVTSHVETDDNGVSTLVLSGTDGPRFLSSDWNGMIEAKGGLLNVVFLVSLFDLKGHSPLELEVVDLESGLFRPRSGLRSAEVNAPPLLPFKSELTQVGDDEDLRTNNYANQLVVGFTKISDNESVKNVIFRVPYYYNKNGKSWSKVEYIVKNWMPANVNARVQYPYLSADLWTVGDAFFEPNFVEAD
jgi:hypothetical protein